MTTIDRRTLLRGAAVTAGGAVVGGPLAGFLALPSQADRSRPDFRHLRAIPDQRDDVVRLWLPEGFSYRSFHDTTDPTDRVLSDGTRIPGRHDGMAAFPGPDGHSVLIRNHEINDPAPAPFSATAPFYDSRAGGGTTSVVVDGEGHVAASWASLAGTMMNCSGGPMPWGAWVTCEETINGPDVFDDFTRGSLPPTTYIKNAQLTRPHGYVFEVPVEGAASAQPVRKAGRFAHEAIAVDPAEGAAYLTEDDFGFPSGFYKYVPPRNPVEVGELVDGGQLFMLAVKGWPNAPLADSQRLRATFQTVWVPVDDPDPDFPRLPDGTPTTTNDDAIHYVAGQGWAQGAAYFSRLEGAVYDNGVVYFCSTQGGGEPEDPDISTTRPSGYGKGSGQIWAYHCLSGRLQLLYQAPDRDTLDFPDNITASPRGTLVICEDNFEDNYLRGLSRGGQLWDLALNRLPNRTNDEFAGSTFSPDGSTLYVNIQASNGMSFAIWGPWERVGV